jgi:hypothetical protein
MASSIDATKPTAGAALTADVRNNFSAAKTEIEALQTAVAAAGDFKSDGTVAMTGAIATTVGTMTSSVANGASAKAFSFNTSGAYTTTAKLASWANNGTEKAYIKQDGTAVLSGGITSLSGTIRKEAGGTAHHELDNSSAYLGIGCVNIYSHSVNSKYFACFAQTAAVGWGSGAAGGTGTNPSLRTSFVEDSSGVVAVTNGSTIADGGAYRDVKVRSYLVDATNTATGTTGAQTINKSAGTVNFAAAATTLVVTNSLVSTSSLVFCTIRTNDTTALIKNVVPAAGSFTITLNAAATAETSVGFIVHN